MTSGGSSFVDRIDVIVLTWNEEANLERTLDALRAFPRIVVLDSGSTDSTLEIATRHPNVRICRRAFDNHAAQWNYALTACGLQGEWVLALDADYVLTQALVTEICALDPAPATGAYRASFRYCIDGKPLSGSLYPPVTVLYKREEARYFQDGHTQRISAAGRVLRLEGPILHDDRKQFSEWLVSQDRYAQLECAALAATPWHRLRTQDKLRRLLVITPWLVPLYCLTVGRGLFDGKRGLLYAMQRAIAESLLACRLLQRKLNSENQR
jgi:glycosyltransferase involved in cell wall biosynthesis